MKKFTFLLIALLIGAFALSAQPKKAPARSSIYNSLPSGFQQLGSSSIYYRIAQNEAAGPGSQYGISILGKIGNQYYSSTYQAEDNSWFYPEDRPGVGFIAAFQVNNGTATYLNALNGTTSNGVRVTTSLEAQGDVAARIIYKFTNNNNEAVTVNAGVWGDIMIGDNDEAPLERLTTSTDKTYGIKMKYSTAQNTPLLCALFGEGVTGCTAADNYWFGFFSSNWHANEIVGNYSNTIYATNTNWGQSYAQYYMVENGSYDSGLGFCWTGREIPAGESIELSYVISVGEIDFEEPIDPDPEPGEDIRTLNLEAFDCDGWNDYEADHPIRIWGYYEHPYGQEGYFEYQIDNETDFHRLETIISGEDFDQNFNVSYDPDKTDYHVIRVRFNDGLDNVSAVLDSLAWIDVRSYQVIGFEDRVYNGAPQVYEYTVSPNRETLTYVGETNAGTYTATVAQGAFAEGTMGVKTVEYFIDKAESAVNVVLPEDAPYDELPHAATVTVTAGEGDLTVTYIKIGATAGSDQAPTEVGVYYVIVEVAETANYYGYEGTFGPFEIYDTETAVNELTVVGEDNGAWYTIDGRRVAAPTERGLYIHNGKKYIVK